MIFISAMGTGNWELGGCISGAFCLERRYLASMGHGDRITGSFF